MKKFFFLVAFLSASMMTWAGQFCNTLLTADNAAAPAGDCWNDEVYFTASKTGDFETTFSITSTKRTLTGTIFNGQALMQNPGGGTLDGNFAEGWTLSGNTLTKVAKWSVYPTGNIQVYVVIDIDNNGAPITGAQIPNLDVSSACGGGDPTPDPDPTESSDVNFALATHGSSATASSGNAGSAIDGNQGSRWESEKNDNEWFLLNMGQSRTFNYFKINWEDAYAKKFQLLASADGETFTTIYSEANLDHASWQKIYLETPVTAQYIKYQGIERATQWGQSFFEFEVYYLSEPPKTYTQITGLTIAASSEGSNDVNRVLDGNAGTEWQGSPTNATPDTEEGRTFDAWFVVDLGGLYNVDKVDIMFEGACAQDYHIDFSENSTTWNLGYNFVGDPGIYGRTDEVTKLNNNTKVRYVRFWSTKAATPYGMKIFEFRVYGTAWVPATDTEKPVMVSANLVSKTHNSAVIAVEATDDNEVAKYHVVDLAKSFDAYFVPNDGQITVTGLSPKTDYYLLVYAVDVVNKESELSQAVSVTTDAYASEPQAACAAPTWPADQVVAIYSPTYNADCGFGEWGSGTQVSDTEFGKKYVLSGGGYFGMEDFSINAMMMDTLHFDIWIAEDATIGVVPIWGGTEQRVVVSLKGQQWNSINIAKAQYSAITDWSNINQLKIDQAANLTFWMANAYFYRATPIDDDEAPTNVQGTMASAGYFSVTLALSADDNMGVVNFSVKNGENEVATGGGAAGSTVNVVVPDLLPNTEYNFSVIATDTKGNAADAIQVAAKTVVAPAAAPKPSFTGKSAVAIFCDELDNAPDIVIGNWGQSTIVTNGELAAGDNVQYLSNFNYLGWELAPAVNATDMEYLHLDIYSTSMATIQLTPISPGHEYLIEKSLTNGEWTSLDIALSEYAAAGIEWNNVFQFKFYGGNGSGDFFVDNVYFYKNDGPGTATANVQEDKVQVTKVIENGQLYILNNGTKYNVQGARLQ